MISLTVKGQLLNPPSWTENDFTLTTAKLTRLDSNKKVISDDYLDCKTSIKRLTDFYYNILIDIPNNFYMKEGVCQSVKYESDEEGYNIAYTAFDEKKLAVVRITVDQNSRQPREIIVVTTDNYSSKQPITKSYVLYEIK